MGQLKKFGLILFIAYFTVRGIWPDFFRLRTLLARIFFFALALASELMEPVKPQKPKGTDFLSPSH